MKKNGTKIEEEGRRRRSKNNNFRASKFKPRTRLNLQSKPCIQNHTIRTKLETVETKTEADLKKNGTKIEEEDQTFSEDKKEKPLT